MEDLHGGAANSSGSIGTLCPASAEAAAVQAGRPRILALVAFLGEVYEQAIDIEPIPEDTAGGIEADLLMRGRGREVSEKSSSDEAM